jgi:hypothetical protein
MHVVEHHDDLFYWKKYNNHTHISTLYKCNVYDVILNIVMIVHVKYNVVTLLVVGLCCVKPRMSRGYF